MVLEAVAETAEALFSYNRGNFLYDRKLRQEQEISILEFRNQQAELWREDIRDIFEMTQKKMDNYAIVAALLCDMCIAFFTEGRLERATPVWLLYFYMVTLGSAFMYLLMSLWFAMQASVVANCSSVRLLTQFVRLPVPTCKQIEDMRTYGSSYESLSTSSMLRVPLVQRSATVTPHDENSIVGDDAVAGSSTSRSFTRTTPPARDSAVDPWGLECHGDARGLSELQDTNPVLRPHISLARCAAVEYQGFDAFARVSLSFGINNFLYAILYYCLGYAAIELGSLWPAWCIVVILTAIISVFMSVDFSPTTKERRLAKTLIVIGPLCGTMATSLHWLRLGENNHFEGSKKAACETAIAILCGIAYASHACWLLWALGACGIKKQANGAVIPTKFRAVLYLDIFGWMSGRPKLPEQKPADPRASPVAVDATIHAGGIDSLPQERNALLRLRDQLQQDLERWLAELERQTLTVDEEARVHDLMARSKKLLASVAAELGQPVPTNMESDDLGLMLGFQQTVANACRNFFDLFNSRRDYVRLLNDNDDEARHFNPSHSSRLTETQAVRWAPTRLIFAPATFAPRSVRTKPSQHTVRHFEPGRFPARAFYGATTMVLLLWVAGSIFCRFLVQDPVEQYPTIQGGTDDGTEGGTVMDFKQGAVKFVTLPAFFPETDHELEALPNLESIEVEWPEHEGFFPRALSSDVSGTQLVVADDFGLYHAKLERFEREQTKLDSRGFLDSAENQVPAERLVAKFRSLQPCSSIEGQGLEDMTVSCLSNSSCNVFVLLRDGKHFVECPLDVLSINAGSSKNHEKSHKTTEEDVTWTISQQWLASGNPNEQVDAIAVNSQCLHSSKSKANAAKDSKADVIGCVLVGTTGGRVLQLRRHLTEHRVLVPARTLYRQQRPVAHGGLNSLASGMVVALSQKQGKAPASVLALNPQDGSVRGNWKLPTDTTWLTFSGGGDSLFALGIRDAFEPELFKFSKPPAFSHQVKSQ